MSQTGERRRGSLHHESPDAADEQVCSSTRARAFELIAQGFSLLAEDARRKDAVGRGAAIVTTDNVAAEFPGMTARAFADAGRRREFPAFKSGRKLAAKRTDVTKWIESRLFEPRPRKAKPKTIDPEIEYAALAQRGFE